MRQSFGRYQGLEQRCVIPTVHPGLSGPKDVLDLLQGVHPGLVGIVVTSELPKVGFGFGFLRGGILRRRSAVRLVIGAGVCGMLDPPADGAGSSPGGTTFTRRYYVYPNTVTDDATLKTGDAGARIACGVGGSFDRASGHYRDNDIAFAPRRDAAPPLTG